MIKFDQTDPSWSSLVSYAFAHTHTIRIELTNVNSDFKRPIAQYQADRLINCMNVVSLIY